MLLQPGRERHHRRRPEGRRRGPAGPRLKPGSVGATPATAEAGLEPCWSGTAKSARRRIDKPALAIRRAPRVQATRSPRGIGPAALDAGLSSASYQATRPVFPYDGERRRAPRAVGPERMPDLALGRDQAFRCAARCLFISNIVHLSLPKTFLSLSSARISRLFCGF